METKFKMGDLVKIWLPDPLRTGEEPPKRLFDAKREVDNWLLDCNHGKLGLIVEIDLQSPSNPIYNVLINGQTKPKAYGQHCLREV
jgi:hypothetical protein